MLAIPTTLRYVPDIIFDRKDTSGNPIAVNYTLITL
jgi:hypothetical protein